MAAAQVVVDKATKSLKSANYYYKNTYVPEKFTVEQRTPGSRKMTKYIAAPSDADIATARGEYALAQATLQEAKDYVAALKGEEVSATATGTSLNAFEQAKLDLQNAKTRLWMLSSWLHRSPVRSPLYPPDWEIMSVPVRSSPYRMSAMSPLIFTWTKPILIKLLSDTRSLLYLTHCPTPLLPVKLPPLILRSATRMAEC